MQLAPRSLTISRFRRCGSEAVDPSVHGLTSRHGLVILGVWLT